MFSYLKVLSQHRAGWFLLIISSLSLEATALYFQHGMGLNPCVMCIYERLALLAILVAGVIGFIAPRSLLLRWLGLLVGLYGGLKGLSLAIKHTDYQLNPAPWNQCSPFVDFPPTLPLNQWFPQVFEATGNCGKISWQLWGFSMPQWLILVFAIYSVMFILLIFSQFKRSTRHKNRDLFH